MKKDHIYKGIRTASGTAVVTIDGFPFNHRPSLKVWNHSPTGFEWGYGGSGPAQLALAILLKETDKEVAQQFYQDFKRDVISCLPKDEWVIKSYAVRIWLEDTIALQKEQRQ